ncbi:MAG: methyltransferase domain-containing protein [Peptococcaceae bacterium]|nr:methyltransferase domain-containing protein [Peptococcaceae bacterium]
MSVLKIVQRYSAETETDNLSCGNNLAFATLAAGDIVIDLGCGRGRETIAAALAVNAGYAYGLDITPQMIEAAEAAAVEQGIANVKFSVGSFELLPYPADFATVIMSNCAINHVQDKQKVYSEIYRVLQNGGYFIVSDIMAQQALPPEITSDPEAVAACFGGAIPSDMYFAAISKAGFDEVEVLKERHYVKNGYGLISRTLRAYKQA